MSIEQVLQLVASRWKLDGKLEVLADGNRERLSVSVDGGPRRELKLSASSPERAFLTAQNTALRHLSAKLDGLEVATPIPDQDGAAIVVSGDTRARLFPWLEGTLMADADDVSPRALGDLAGRVTSALDSYSHSASERDSTIDTRRAPEVIAELSADGDPRQQALYARALTPWYLDTAAVADSLPLAVVHGEISSATIGKSAADGRFVATGLIDPGHLVRTWQITEPAAAAADAIAKHPGDAAVAAMKVLAAYREHVLLEEVEADAFWPVLLAQTAIRCARSNGSAARTRALEAALTVPFAFGRAAARSVCGFEPAPASRDLAVQIAAAKPLPLVADLEHKTVVPVALDPRARADVQGDWWKSRSGVQRLIDALLPDRGDETIAVGLWGEERRTQPSCVGAGDLPTLHLGTDIFCPVGTPVRAPLDGRVATSDLGTLDFQGGPIRTAVELAAILPGSENPAWVRIGAIEPAVDDAATVSAGDVIGHVTNSDDVLPPHVHVQICAARDLPPRGDPRMREPWLALCPDPSALIGIGVAARHCDDDT